MARIFERRIFLFSRFSRVKWRGGLQHQLADRESRRILLPTRAESFEDWAALMVEEGNSRHIGGLQSRTIGWRALLCMAGAWMGEGFGMFSVIEKISGRSRGLTGPWQFEGWPGTEITRSLVHAAWERPRA